MLSSCNSTDTDVIEGPINASVEVITQSREFVEYAQVVEQMREASSAALQDTAPLDQVLLTNAYKRYVNDHLEYAKPLETQFRSMVSTNDFNKLNAIGSELLIKQAALNSKYNVKNLTEADQKLFLSILFKDETYNPEPEGVLFTKTSGCYLACSDALTNSLEDAKFARNVAFLTAGATSISGGWGGALIGAGGFVLAIYIYDKAVESAISRLSVCQSRCKI